MTDCPRFNKWIRGCNFEARYDKGPKDARRKTYVRDVCTSCGKTIERLAAPVDLRPPRAQDDGLRSGALSTSTPFDVAFPRWPSTARYFKDD
jgi:hypothetical protein